MANHLRRIDDIINQYDIKVLSVDVFDTVLLRTTRPELQRFKDFCRLQLKYLQLGDQVSLELFYRARLKAGREAYKKANLSGGAYEARYQDIYSDVADKFSSFILGDKQRFVEKCLSLELAREAAGLKLNSSLWHFLKKKKREGIRLIYCSDMYLDGQSVKLLLESISKQTLEEELIVSSDYQQTKRKGALFETLISFTHTVPGRILHIGDNFHSDYRKPQMCGINSYYFPRSPLWRIVSQARKRLYRSYLQMNGSLSL
ncbi:hypothetical protein [Kiloniella litopenaei]|uniref:hypothetical protein n=1 Tax=Kiloniella litopenaei TaxID=1549748 RepID=UPI003BAC00EF